MSVRAGLCDSMKSHSNKAKDLAHFDEQDEQDSKMCNDVHMMSSVALRYGEM